MSFEFGTDFLETEALLAAQEENYLALTDILDRMLPSEVRELCMAADRLRSASLAFLQVQEPLGASGSATSTSEA